MSKKMLALIAAVLLAHSAFAAADTPIAPVPLDVKQAAVDEAVAITQFMTAAICHETANMAPAAIRSRSSVFQFVLAFKHMAPSVDVLGSDRGNLGERLKSLRCDKDGLLQLK